MSTIKTRQNQSNGNSWKLSVKRSKNVVFIKQKRYDVDHPLWNCEARREEEERFSLIKGINIKLHLKMFRNKISLILLKIISVLKILLSEHKNLYFQPFFPTFFRCHIGKVFVREEMKPFSLLEIGRGHTNMRMS